MTYDDIDIVHASELLALVLLKADLHCLDSKGVLATVSVSRDVIRRLQQPMRKPEVILNDEILVQTPYGYVKFIARSNDE